MRKLRIYPATLNLKKVREEGERGAADLVEQHATISQRDNVMQVAELASEVLEKAQKEGGESARGSGKGARNIGVFVINLHVVGDHDDEGIRPEAPVPGLIQTSLFEVVLEDQGEWSQVDVLGIVRGGLREGVAPPRAIL